MKTFLHEQKSKIFFPFQTTAEKDESSNKPETAESQQQQPQQLQPQKQPSLLTHIIDGIQIDESDTPFPIDKGKGKLTKISIKATFSVTWDLQ